MNLPWYTLRYLGQVFGLSHVQIRNIGRGEP
jgi:hypothetical protein